ncbi:hypothetical protein LU699_02200 [Luteimonas fraxinea]|uniref:Uncharacterized protein n=1 Tax=Luteimonas fraxinea TaxID=2901869 RepID=A0ABS8UG15_9GAMM|nr:hypothetical protein [Luteimonas fraxinea]MCD9098457.1 hypothetical protein [Luteimonas fraxinea]MCD9127190.1 hypothetical protein [Luteimonas fraxinea]UHH10568.1 hypothetical protein LU699_02200 [Luteimonas fraxinea]
MRWLKRLGLGLLVVVLVLAALWTWSRLNGPTPEQRAALAVLEAPNAFEGRNAFDAVWLLRYDVPEAEIASVADADMAALSSAPALRSLEPQSIANMRYADLQPDRSTPLTHCQIAGEPCLALVRSDTDGYAALVEANRKLIARVEALAQYDHLASRLPVRVDGPIPPFSLLAWPLTAHAVAFTQGDRLAAVDATCRALSTTRRLGANSDLLISRVHFTRLVTEGYGRLLADMLVELPADIALPDSCAAAVSAPTEIEASVCPALRGEFALGQRVAQQMASDEVGEWLVFDQHGYAAMAADRVGQGCTDAAAEALRLDRRFVSEDARPFFSRFECIANSAGCILSDIAGPAYDGYVRAGQDHYARLQLVGTLAWLRAQPAEGALSERLARRPDGLRSAARDITVSADGRALQIAQYDTRQQENWSLPLPAYLVESTAAAD